MPFRMVLLAQTSSPVIWSTRFFRSLLDLFLERWFLSLSRF